MKRLLAAAAITSLLGWPVAALSENDSWFPIGVNENRIAVGWVQLSSYESLNSDSFRLRAKLTNANNQQVTGRIDLNCKNKDYYFRPDGILTQRGPWAAIPSGSGIETIGNYFCKRTAAKSDWGYSNETRHLWDQPEPKINPGDAKGDWILVDENDESEAYYNTDITKSGDVLLVATWSRAKKGDRSAAQPADTQGYWWIHVDCKSNKYSLFFQPERSVQGTWLAPVSGRPGGTAMLTRKEYCRS